MPRVKLWRTWQCVLFLSCFSMNQPDECPRLCLQSSQAVLQLLVPPNEVHSPHCDVQETLAPPQQKNSLTLLLLVFQYLFPTALLMPPRRGITIHTSLTSILRVIAVTRVTVAGEVRLFLALCCGLLPQVVSCDPHSW